MADKAMFLRNLFLKKTDDGKIHLFRASFASIFAFGVDISVLLALTHYLDLHYLVALRFSFIAGTIVSYVLNVLWVFNKRKVSKSYIEFGIFIILSLATLGFNSIIMKFFTETVKTPLPISRIIASMSGFFFGFICRKYILFK